MTVLKTQAIQSALVGDFENAASLNKKIIESDPNDVETLNRLAFAYTSLGKIKEAKNVYQKVLQLDTLNSIALRGIKKLNQSYPNNIAKKTNDGNNHHREIVSPKNNIFLEETGKTKIVELINIADKKTSSTLRMGESITLSIKRFKIFLLNSDKNYIGMLPDDIGKRLIRFIKGNYRYEAYIKSITETSITVFIKEVKRSNLFKNQPTFISQERKRLIIDKSSRKKSED